jgi:WD40 repeat protein
MIAMRVHLKPSAAASRRLLLAACAVVLFGLWLGVFLRLKPAAARASIPGGSPGDAAEISSDSRHLVVRGQGGVRITTSPRGGISLPYRGPVRVVRVDDGSLVESIFGVGDPVGRAVVAPDGKHIAIESLLRWQLFRVGSQEPIARFAVPEAPPGGQWWQSAVTFSADGRRLAVAMSPPTNLPEETARVMVWDIESSKELFRTEGDHGPVSFSPCGRLVATWRGSSILLRDPDSGRIVSTLEGLNGGPPFLEFNADGRFLAAIFPTEGFVMVNGRFRSSALCNEVMLWSVDPPRLVHRWSRCRRFAFAEDKPILCLHTGNMQLDYAVEHWCLPLDYQGETKLVWRLSGWSDLASGRYALHTRTDTWAPHPIRKWAMEACGTPVPPYRDTTSIQLADWQGNTWQIETEGRANAQLSPDEKTLLVHHTDGRIELYDVPPARPVVEFALISAVVSLCFTFLLWWRLGR